MLRYSWAMLALSPWHLLWFLPGLCLGAWASINAGARLVLKRYGQDAWDRPAAHVLVLSWCLVTASSMAGATLIAFG